MNIFLHEDAKRILEVKKIPNNSCGIFIDNNRYSWWTNKENQFDCGDSENFNLAFNIIKK